MSKRSSSAYSGCSASATLGDGVGAVCCGVGTTGSVFGALGAETRGGVGTTGSVFGAIGAETGGRVGTAGSVFGTIGAETGGGVGTTGAVCAALGAATGGSVGTAGSDFGTIGAATGGCVGTAGAVFAAIGTETGGGVATTGSVFGALGAETGDTLGTGFSGIDSSIGRGRVGVPIACSLFVDDSSVVSAAGFVDSEGRGEAFPCIGGSGIDPTLNSATHRFLGSMGVCGKRILLEPYPTAVRRFAVTPFVMR